MIWNNENNNKFIYMLKLGILEHLDTFFVDTFFVDKDLELHKTNKATKVTVDTLTSMSIATIITNTSQGIIYLPNIDVQYTNEKTKQFAFITKSKAKAHKEVLITNDKQLMMRIIKKIINKKITRIEEWRISTIRQNYSALIHTYLILYDNTREKLYQLYKILNAKIKSL